MRETSSVVVLDGSQGEGGGAMVRTALAMAALTELPVLIESVRGGTAHSGVDAEDIAFVGALAKSCDASVGRSLVPGRCGFRRSDDLGRWTASCRMYGTR